MKKYAVASVIMDDLNIQIVEAEHELGAIKIVAAGGAEDKQTKKWIDSFVDYDTAIEKCHQSDMLIAVQEIT